MAPPSENDLIEREILTALKNRRKLTGVRPMISEILPETRLADKDWRDEAWRFDRLAEKGLVKTGSARLQRWVELVALGEERISMSEDEWRRTVNHPGSTLYNNTTINGPVNTLAQSLGPYSPVVQLSGTEAAAPAFRPEVTVHWEFHTAQNYKETTGFRLLIENTGQAVAVNISAFPLSFEMPETYIRNLIETESLLLEGSIPDRQKSKTWNVTFGHVDKLVPGSGQSVLPYDISRMSPLSNRNIGGVLQHLIGWDAKVRFNLILVYSDAAHPIGEWHTHYESVYSWSGTSERQSITSHFSGLGYVVNGKCPYCRADSEVFLAPRKKPD